MSLFSILRPQKPLREPDVSLSTHPASIIRPDGNTPRRQWANQNNRKKSQFSNSVLGWGNIEKSITSLYRHIGGGLLINRHV
jgi:hypothetical protein